MPRIIIGSDVIEFPTSGTDANWAPAVDQFAVAVEEVLGGIVSIYDVTPQVQEINIGGGGSDSAATDIEKCVFDYALLRGFTFYYSLYRTNGTLGISENGTVTGSYNTLTALWEIEHSFSGVRKTNGSLYHIFSMSGNILQLTATAITGSVSGSKISYSAKAFKKD